MADTGDVARFTDRNRFASWTGTAPIEASSGQIARHRLSRAGNRRMNHMTYIAATTQIRLDTDGRAYYRRKRAEGKTRAEAMRCLKRRISDALYRQLRTDSKRTSAESVAAGPGGHRGATQIQRGRLTPAHRHFGSATSRTRTNDATRAHHDTKRPRRPDPSNRPLDIRGVPMRSRIVPSMSALPGAAPAGCWCRRTGPLPTSGTTLFGAVTSLGLHPWTCAVASATGTCRCLVAGESLPRTAGE